MMIQSFISQYLSFKQELLYALIDKDPLEVLQSGIFQRFQIKAFGSCDRQQRQGGLGKYETQISTVSIEDDFEVKVVERRAKSCHKQGKDYKVQKLEERNKIDLHIWSNIMHNHFLHSKKQSKEEFVLKQKEDRSKVEDGQAEINIKELQQQIERMRKQLQELSYKELQWMVKQKQFKKRQEKMQKELVEAQQMVTELKQKEKYLDKAMLGKIRQIQKRSIIYKKNTIEDLKEKIMIDSLRRNTLLGLSRENTQILLKKQELGLLQEEQNEMQTLSTCYE